LTGALHKASDTIGARYKVLSYVAEGGMQEVYLAEDLLLNRQVALKAPKNESAKKRFQRSAIVSARVNHANVAKTLDYLETDERAYLIEEFIEGDDLGNVMKAYFEVLDPYIAARTFHHLSKGLAASHHAGVVHRDLKPSNIMVVGGEKFLNLKITDFGIAKMAEEELAEAVKGEESFSASQTALGALPYMAPEAINSMPDVGKPADVWSLGAVMFELIAGSKPFGVGYKAVPAILKAVVPNLPVSVLRNTQFRRFAEELHGLIKLCLVADPAKRLTADELVQKCKMLCYSVGSREFGTISRFDNPAWGFIQPLSGKGVFFNVASIFGDRKIAVGDTVWFERHEGEGNDRAFPILKVKKTT
jgi:serine/threonine-protein kinase